MASSLISIGDVVWLNSGQGAFTVTELSDSHAVISQGSATSLQTYPIACLSSFNPNPELDAERRALEDQHSSTSHSSVSSASS